jgi:hypothetical protein
MTRLLEKMKREMLLIGFAESTQQHYIKEVMQLHNYYNKSLADLSGEEMKSYLLHLKKRN